MAGSTQNPLLMVVDDDDPTRMMASEFLTQAGFDVVDFECGTSALENLFEHSPDFCLLYTSPSPRDKRQTRMPSSA